MPETPQNLAALPVPSSFPMKIDPASVLTTAAVVTRRIKLDPSETKRFPAASAAKPVGNEKLADAPIPSVMPDDPAVPASVLTAPPGVILRRVLLRSAT